MRSTPWGTYARIAETLRERLADVAPGSALPSETSLAAEFGVVRNTVRRALAELERDGLIVTLPGRVWVPNRSSASVTCGITGRWSSGMIAARDGSTVVSDLPAAHGLAGTAGP
ncbi:MAG: winged helix-turn-helix domain-containing protein [Actinomycetota bacterium]|nr:winged helix-turn-helix domain-containing protein [Actinomycetota bacterium]